MDWGGISQKGWFFHDASPIINKHGIQNIDKVLDKRQLLLKFDNSSQILAVMVGSCHIIFAYTILNLRKKIRVVMVLGDLHVLLGILDHLLRQIVEQTREKMMCGDEPAPWLPYRCELLHYSFD